MSDGNYINMRMMGEHAQLNELRTRDEFLASTGSEGAIEGSELPFEEDSNENQQ